MKKIKHLILFCLLILLCSFDKGKFSIDFGVGGNGTPLTSQVMEFSYGQSVILVSPNVSKIEDINEHTVWTRIKTSKGENYAVINSKKDLTYIKNITLDNWERVPKIYAIVPFNNYGLEGDTFVRPSELCEELLDTVCPYEEQNSYELLVYLAKTDKSLYIINGEDNYKPVINGSTSVYVTNVNNPISVEEIKAMLKAYDNVDGDISDKIVISEDSYSSSSKKVGEYSVVFEVSDSSKNSASITIMISVVDTDKPIINGPSEIQSLVSNPLYKEDILSQVSISDNADDDLSYEINQDTYSGNETKKGTYIISLKVSDHSENTTTKDIKIIVKDDIKPTISGTKKIKAPYNKLIDLEEVKKGLKIKDNNDVNLSSKDLILVNDTYSENYNKLGDYYLEYKVVDSDQNSSDIFRIVVSVVDDELPSFFIKDVVINLDYYVTLNHQQLIDLLIKGNNLDISNISDIDKQVVVTYDDYKENEAKGRYRVNLKVTYDDGRSEDLAININKLGKKDENTETPKPNINKAYMEANSWLKNFIEHIINFFKSIFR